ncbi:DUF4173 domain-containing protein [Gordonia sp. TBRC 11910]|uniref:DUF4173 domain-containing protein n=1 Tax=Gordonia asplenii TaxID=2725283 RepID=A0A848KVC8_9ACTN|nr:DUF4153 domain-containing protein [Gordonia asplenii]NMO02212.1 DUF4173 domain-containing protein [Gordonia asplenii]
MPENSEPDSSTPGNSSTDASDPTSTPRPDEPSDAAPTSPTLTTDPPPSDSPTRAAPPPRRTPHVAWWVSRHTDVVFPRSTLLSALAVGVLGALCWRPADLGIGLTITGIAAVATVMWSAPDDFRRRLSPYWIAVMVGVVALLLVPTFRAAGWVTVFCLFAAVVASAALFVEARGIRGLWLASLSPFLAPFLAAVTAVRRPPRVARTGTRPSITLIAVVATTTIVLLVVFGALFASADATFGSLFKIQISTDAGPTIAAALFSGIFVAVVTLGGIALVSQGTDYPDRPRPTTPIWAWATPVGALFAMFLLFLGVQATAWFGGDDFVRRTADLTYSQYAVQGFWQLLIVGVLVIGVTVSAWHFVDADDARSRRAARILLGGLCIATLAVGASAIHRMTGYIHSYGMTEERIFGIFVELLVGIVIVGFLIAGARMSTVWLTKSIVVAGLFATVGFAAINPDQRIASYNIDRFETAGKLDTFYLGGLSADASGEFDRLPADLRACVDWRFARDHDAARSWRAFTFSRYTPPAQADRWYDEHCVRHVTHR